MEAAMVSKMEVITKAYREHVEAVRLAKKKVEDDDKPTSSWSFMLLAGGQILSIEVESTLSCSVNGTPASSMPAATSTDTSNMKVMPLAIPTNALLLLTDELSASLPSDLLGDYGQAATSLLHVVVPAVPAIPTAAAVIPAVLSVPTAAAVVPAVPAIPTAIAVVAAIPAVPAIPAIPTAAAAVSAIPEGNRRKGKSSKLVYTQPPSKGLEAVSLSQLTAPERKGSKLTTQPAVPPASAPADMVTATQTANNIDKSLQDVSNVNKAPTLTAPKCYTKRCHDAIEKKLIVGTKWACKQTEKMEMETLAIKDEVVRKTREDNDRWVEGQHGTLVGSEITQVGRRRCYERGDEVEGEPNLINVLKVLIREASNHVHWTVEKGCEGCVRDVVRLVCLSGRPSFSDKHRRSDKFSASLLDEARSIVHKSGGESFLSAVSSFMR
ncbi:hypothetical protein IMY05_C4670000100 [Salix suchowensis]|nr:hypothetical protein IMY05_C4670000100 [Salix suchowensis]